jgi:hypothetical protein
VNAADWRRAGVFDVTKLMMAKLNKRENYYAIVKILGTLPRSPVPDFRVQIDDQDPIYPVRPDSFMRYFALTEVLTRNLQYAIDVQ